MPVNLNSIFDAVYLLVACLGAFLAALWLSLIIWTFRDMRARSRDVFAAVLAAAVVAVLTLPGLIVYLILRPPKTLSETYEQSLEEEALLQEIEDKRVCPGCSRQVNEEWMICPNCLTKLKKTCANCGKLMDLPWNVCPHCATPVEGKPMASDEAQAEAAVG
ncbi:MAG: double zinc ribbon domain-containing protein [Anaerolineales bacterium]